MVENFNKSFIKKLACVITIFVTSFLLSSLTHASDSKLKILMISPEQSGVLQTGGLAHATADLAVSMNQEGYELDVMMPHYTNMGERKITPTGFQTVVPMDYHNGVAHKFSKFSLGEENNPAGGKTLFMRHENRAGEQNYFENSNGGKPAKAYAPDEHIGESFAALAKAQTDYILSQNYDVVILNDWTAGLVALHLQIAKWNGVKTPKVIFAIHNIAYQGLFPKSLADFMGIDEKFFNIEGYEFWGKMSFLKAGLQYADLIYTVSSQYAKEIATERFGAGLDGLIRKKFSEGKVIGILNGIVNKKWDPSIASKDLEHTFTVDNLEGKSLGKLKLQNELGLPAQADTPLFVLTSRLAEQKGFEYLIDAIHASAAKSNAQWIIIGDGDEKYIAALKQLESQYPNKIRTQKFDGLLEKKLMRYGDFFVNGAWFEPSGLNQFFALKNGTLPVVSAAGGLLDSVKDGTTGVLFNIIPGKDKQPYDTYETKNLAVHAFDRAIAIYSNKLLLANMRQAAMHEDNSWTARIKKYFDPLFANMIQSKRSAYSNVMMCKDIL